MTAVNDGSATCKPRNTIDKTFSTVTQHWKSSSQQQEN